MLVPSNILLPIEILLSTLINEYLRTSFCLTFVTETELRTDLPSNITSMRFKPNNSELVQQILDASEKACTDYIIQMDQPQDFMIAFEKVNHIGDVRRSDKKLIFVASEDEFYNASVLIDLLSLKETGYVPNILLISPTVQSSADCKVYDMITHIFVGAEEQIHEPIYLDRWDSCTELFEQGANLFPHDMRNLQGKKVKVGAFTYKPYVLLDLDPSLAPLGRDGIDIRFIEEFCRWINCTVEIVRPDDGQEWGEIYENNTGVGLVGNLVEDRTEIGITSLYSWYEEYRALDFSAPIIRTAVTCIAPAPRILSSWDLPLVPFSWLMWMCLIATFFFASFALFVAQRSTDDIFFATFGNMIGQSPADSSSWRIRSISAWMLVIGLVIDNAYSGGLASSFTVPKYEASVDTIQDLVDRRMEWGAPVDAWLYSMILSEEPLIKSAISQFKVYPPETLTQKSFSRSMAFSIERLPAGSFAIGEYITKEGAKNLELMVEDMYYEQCVVMTRKSSPYTAKLTELVGRLQQSGLLLCWETQIALKYLDFKVQLEVRLSRTKKDIDGVEPLNVKQLLGIYLLYFGGLSISIAVFIGELLIKRAALYSWYEEYRVLDFSAPIIRTAITCVAPAPRVLTSWDLPLVPFSWTMWMCLVFTFFYASFALSIAQRSTDNVFLDTFGMMITQTREDATSWRIRSITGWMLVTGLIIDNAYGGGLASSFTVPKYETSIDTVEDLVDRRMEWGATHDAWIFSIILSEEPLIKSLLSQFKTYPADILKQKSFSRSMAFSIEHLPAGYFAIGEYITKEAAMDLEIMLDKVYYEQCVVMLRKSSPYTAKLSELVGRLHQSGLMLSWETQVALKYLDFKVQLEVRLSRARKDLEEIEPLSLKKLLGIYIFYFGGVAIALLVFVWELLCKCSKPSIVL
ncbi:uncharacterized protein LOC125226022 [Leguminivora glycinivorella]|uniref:uncharacterized protein LOC125226022 n=1 Tax=Leguminivora glycinivorella TaxID=1035111 RepID=UPI00200EBC71|nr:uncharacterized protein LOC125226022 [Leguminivora glycinivorella]